MDRAARIAIAKRVLALADQDEAEYGDESWETDIGRFVDKERFEIEKQVFFLDRPQLIALSADFPNPGDYYATEIVGRPILLTRDKDGKAHAFLNACRHRGVKIAEGCGHAAGFTCPYHGWTYGTDGALISVPSRQAFEEAQLKGRGLIALPIAEKIGMILVHPQPDGHLDFDEFMGPMGDLLATCDIAGLKLVSEYKAPARINWKHAVDGGVEGYHVPFLHQDTVAPLSLKQFLHLDFGMHQALVSPNKAILDLRDKPESEWPDSCFWSTTNAIFPNTVVGGGGNPIFFFQRSEPGDDPGTCTYIFRTYGRADASGETLKFVKMMSDMLMKVSLEEDMVVQSSAQIMMETGIVPSIVFGKREQNLIRMHKTYDRLLGHDAVKAVRAAKAA